MSEALSLIEEWKCSDGKTEFALMRYERGGYVVSCTKGENVHWWLEFDTEAKANAEFERWRGT